MRCDFSHPGLGFILQPDGSILLPDGRILPPIAGGGGAPAYDQDAFRGRNDDGSETTATWIAAANTNWTQDIDVNANFRVRFVIQETKGNAPGAQTLILMYSYKGGAYTQVTTTSSVIRSVLSANFVDGADCTQQVGVGTFEADNNGMDEDQTITTSAGWAGSEEIEVEFMLQIQVANVVDNDTIALRVYLSGPTALGTYTNTPTITIQEIVLGGVGGTMMAMMGVGH